MSNQLIIPDAGQDESVVVQQFVQAAREIAPTVQISLAKRIIRPGSNKVVCLAAHTSVPLDEDELGSVSDLALRLSDGTNVRLSISFFNDTVNGAFEYAPLNRTYYYDPERYVIKSDSRLGTVLALTSVAAVAGFFYFCMPQLPAWLHKSAPLSGGASASRRQESAARNQQTTKAAFAAAPHMVSPPASEGKEMAVHNWFHHGARAHHAHAQRAARANSPASVSEPQENIKAGRSSMFVPPPPPMTPFFPAAPAQLQNMTFFGIGKQAAAEQDGSGEKSAAVRAKREKPAAVNAAKKAPGNRESALSDEQGGGDTPIEHKAAMKKAATVVPPKSRSASGDTTSLSGESRIKEQPIAGAVKAVSDGTETRDQSQADATKAAAGVHRAKDQSTIKADTVPAGNSIPAGAPRTVTHISAIELPAPASAFSMAPAQRMPARSQATPAQIQHSEKPASASHALSASEIPASASHALSASEKPASASHTLSASEKPASASHALSASEIPASALHTRDAQIEPSEQPNSGSN